MKLLNAASVSIALVVLVVSVKDYRLGRGRSGDLREIGASAQIPIFQEHSGLFVDAILNGIVESTPPEMRRRMILLATRVAKRSVAYHPNDPSAWADYAKCLLILGKSFMAHSAASRAALLDPTHLYIRELQIRTSIASGDRRGLENAATAFAEIKKAGATE